MTSNKNNEINNSLNQQPLDNKKWYHKLEEWLSNYNALIFWGTFIAYTLFFACLGYYFADFLDSSKFLDNFKKLDDWVQNLLSLDGKWIEALSNLMVPFFLLLSIKFYTIEMPARRKKWFFKALPFLPYLKFLTQAPVIFFQGTASAFSGFIAYMMIEMNTRAAILLIFPIIISFLAISFRKLALDDMSKVSKFIRANKNKVGYICLVCALFCWLYSNIFTLISDIFLIVTNLA
jgi:hypothetical protein